jgi:type I site-specific restriction endonuclease
MKEIQEELKKLREEIDKKDEKIRSKLSFLLSRIQDLEKSLDVVKGDLFELENSENSEN